MEEKIELMKEAELARYLGVSRQYLAKLRQLGKGPRWIRISDNFAILYDMNDVREWLESNKQQ